jgi:hypothetical protein
MGLPVRQALSDGLASLRGAVPARIPERIFGKAREGFVAHELHAYPCKNT